MCQFDRVLKRYFKWSWIYSFKVPYNTQQSFWPCLFCFHLCIKYNNFLNSYFLLLLAVHWQKYQNAPFIIHTFNKGIDFFSLLDTDTINGLIMHFNLNPAIKHVHILHLSMPNYLMVIINNFVNQNRPDYHAEMI